MTSTIKQTLHDTVDKAMPHDLGKTANGVMKDLHKAGEKAQADTEDTLSKITEGLTGAAHNLAEELRSHTETIARQAKREMVAHPVATYAALATAVLSLTGLVIAMGQQHKD